MTISSIYIGSTSSSRSIQYWRKNEAITLQVIMENSKKARRPKSPKSKTSKATKAGKRPKTMQPKGGGTRKSQAQKSRAASRMSVAGRRKSVIGQKKSVGARKRESLFASFKDTTVEEGAECGSPSDERHMLNSNRLIISLAVLAVSILFAWLHSSIMFDRYKRMKRIH
ncbi:uncharacterized protein LOC111250231 isoform X2 [Varroa destructor]|uniref:Uncharacterized protein n=2 Tax=Varroa TaxID=62624 RepID=A0A7M7KBP5_VARDE|nr:uncharacterized protein LOC111250231 isoform X2 [Varroa destructor]